MNKQRYSRQPGPLPGLGSQLTRLDVAHDVDMHPKLLHQLGGYGFGNLPAVAENRVQAASQQLALSTRFWAGRRWPL